MSFLIFATAFLVGFAITLTILSIVGGIYMLRDLNKK